MKKKKKKLHNVVATESFIQHTHTHTLKAALFKPTRNQRKNLWRSVRKTERPAVKHLPASYS